MTNVTKIYAAVLFHLRFTFTTLPATPVCSVLRKKVFSSTSLRNTCKHAGHKKPISKTILKVQLSIFPIEGKGSEMNTADVPSDEEQERYRVPVFLPFACLSSFRLSASLVWGPN